MTTTVSTSVDPAQFVLLVREAREAVDSVLRLTEEVEGESERRWAQLCADRASARWEQLVRVLRREDPIYLPPALRGIVGLSVSVEDGPAPTWALASTADGLLEQLAVDLRRVVEPLLGEDRQLRPEVRAALTPVLRQIGEQVA